MVVEIKKPVTKQKIELALQQISRNKKNKKGLDAVKYLGKLKGVFGDGIKYQKLVRNEWK